MVEMESEIEKVLREIRERVRNGDGAARAPDAISLAQDPINASEDGTTAISVGSNQELLEARRALERVEMNLATTERAWNRLPPLLSYRRGLIARLELWIKRQIKRATYWYFWEQINFNSAAHQSLRDLRDALQNMQTQFVALRTETETLRAMIETRLIESETQLTKIKDALAADAADIAQLRQTLVSTLERWREEKRELLEVTLQTISSAEAAMRDALESLNAELRKFIENSREEGQRQLALRTEDLQKQFDLQVQNLQNQIEHQVADLQRELGERVSHVLEEQRVCYKQLALQAGETAVFNDRAWRNFEQRIVQLEKEVKVKE